MSEYNFLETEKKWQKYWDKNLTFQAEDSGSSKPKFYALDMFPYPSGAGLHVGHPLGYIASDIVSRYKRNKGFNVLHPMGFDSFGLPAEQYAVQTGQHPAVTTEENISRYIDQLKNIGFSYDWSREIRTTDPAYYKFTQWIFIQLFNSWYNKETDKAESIETLITKLADSGTGSIKAACSEDTPTLSSSDWNDLGETEQQDFLLNFRLAYLSEALVNWCPELGTVLANDEVKEGLSERGGYPVEKKKMPQWQLRITAYADRLIKGLDSLEWSDAVKEIQKNWIGKSFGCSIRFKVKDGEDTLEVFTTRPDTVFGVTYVSIAPEHEDIEKYITEDQKAEATAYINIAKNKTERERQSDVKTVSGVFTGSYVTHPLTGKDVPLWVADYVLAGYGTGIVMAVPSSDERDYNFATKFNLPIIRVQEGNNTDISQENFQAKAGTMINSEFLNGMKVKDAIKTAIHHIQKDGHGIAKVNYKLRDAVFGRQRYWGEPIPVYYKGETPYVMEESDLPLELPEIDEYKPTATGEPPLGRANDWTYKGHPLEMTTMPGWAGSSWYYFRYMNPKNQDQFVSADADAYWGKVDLYVGGSEHATGHLLYSRFWNKFLFDLGVVSSDDAFSKMVNQGMIQGTSSYVYRINGTNKFVSKGLKDAYKTTALHVDVNIVTNDVLDINAFKSWREEYATAEFELEGNQYICGSEVEKMSKSKYNVVNPDLIVEKFGADTLRMYEMFLGPVEQSKPWNTNGIDGVFKFIKKFWRLFHKEETFTISEEDPTKEELKILHSTIKKITENIETFSLNTAVSNFMIAANELGKLSSNKREILEPLTICLSPFAPHISEELWSLLGHSESVAYAPFPIFDKSILVESDHEYPVMVNGKMRTKIKFPLDKPQAEIINAVKTDEIVQKWLEGKEAKKIIVVPKKIINVVV